jgi:uncharacterized membrane protein YgdD (TMEM256/DUF423 family)
MSRTFIAVAALLGLTGVALGAFGAHGLAAARRDEQWSRRAGWLFSLGVILFSGSLYLLAIFNLRFMGAVAPFGGLALIAGWACLGWSARQQQR